MAFTRPRPLSQFLYIGFYFFALVCLRSRGPPGGPRGPREGPTEGSGGPPGGPGPPRARIKKPKNPYFCMARLSGREASQPRRTSGPHCGCCQRSPTSMASWIVASKCRAPAPLVYRRFSCRHRNVHSSARDNIAILGSFRYDSGLMNNVRPMGSIRLP